jgi:hypothetical protein
MTAHNRRRAPHSEPLHGFCAGPAEPSCAGLSGLGSHLRVHVPTKMTWLFGSLSEIKWNVSRELPVFQV